MAYTRSLGAILESAEHAAAAGDHHTAERCLREAVALQETELGHLHPDLANTLNNLGVVCERVGKFDDAERCYRRAYGIAKRVLVPDHLFVATAEQNLRQFCAARGVPFVQDTSLHGVARLGPDAQSDLSLESNFGSESQSALGGSRSDVPLPGAPMPSSPVPPLPTAGLASPADNRAPFRAGGETPANQPAPATSSQGDSRGTAGAHPPVPPIDASARPQPERAGRPAQTPSRQRPAAHRGSGVAYTTYTLAALAIGAVVLAAWVFSARGRVAQDAPSTNGPETTAPVEPATAAAPLSSVAGGTPTSAAGRRTVRAGAASSDRMPTVLRAAVCRRFVTQGSPDWRCERAGTEAAPGAFVFYTRIAAPRNTTVEHRWYQDGALKQTIELPVRANGAGFRTYSRRVAGVGAWRVELRSRTGDVLHEERFVVR